MCAIVDAPDQSAGEVLSAQLGPHFVVQHGGLDPASGRGALVAEVMRRNDWSQWPHSRPTGIFVDGTDELHDPDGDGNYTNTFAKVLKEGTYNWELFIEGKDNSGNPFARHILQSTHAAVSIDPRGTKVGLATISDHFSGQNAVGVVVTPQDAVGNRLGPGFDTVVIFSLNKGTFEHAFVNKPAPVFTDGTYQRVVLFRGRPPELEIAVTGTRLDPIVLRPDGQ